MELRDYWAILRRRWRVVAAALVITVATAGIITAIATPQYSSTARLFISTSGSDSSQAYTGNLFATQRVASYADLVGSRQLADRVAASLDDGIDAATLSRQVSASAVPETVILQITAIDPSPQRARIIAQAYAEQLTLLVDELETPKGKTDAPIKASVVDDAYASSKPVAPRPTRNLTLAGILGLLLGLGLAVARDLMDRSITSTDDVAGITSSPILGNVFIDAAAKEDPHTVLAEASPWAESFRVLRTNMQYVEVDHDNKVFVITSSLPSEGKSTTSLSLAITMAMANQRVALIECDLRRPLLATRMGLDPAVGTTSVLIGQLSLEDALQSYEDTGLKVLPCGPIPPNPSELLQSQAMRDLIAKMRAEFDIVILDAPPLLPVTDAAVLAAQSDGAVVIVRHGKTTRDHLEHAVERLDSVGAKTLGVVINMTPSKSAHSYGGGYGYGYGYGGDQRDSEHYAAKSDAAGPKVKARKTSPRGDTN